jgi:hypothetical protein
MRLVESGDQLLDVVLESLRRLQVKLQGETPAAPFLWDGPRPKEENQFSDFVKLHLEDDLTARGIIVNREVQIHRGERTDLHVDAVAGDRSDATYRKITVIVECKGCWHRELDNAMETQLVGQYLRENQCQHGIYLVGWFNCESWDKQDARRQVAERQCPTKEGTQLKLDAQAKGLSVDGLHIKALVLDAALG